MHQPYQVNRIVSQQLNEKQGVSTAKSTCPRDLQVLDLMTTPHLSVCYAQRH